MPKEFLQRTLCLAFIALALLAGIPHFHSDGDHSSQQCPVCQMHSQCGHYLTVTAIELAAVPVPCAALSSPLLLPCSTACPNLIFSRPPPTA